MKKNSTTSTGIQFYQNQWGTPTHDDQLLFELLTVGTFQVGLGWKMVVNKRDVFLRNFQQMDILKIAAMMPDDVERIMEDPAMIRNPRKINATITNARAIIGIQKEYGSFAAYLWQFVDNQTIEYEYTEASEVPTSSPLSEKVAKELKKKGFKFVGPIVTYMFMKASGLVHDTIIDR
ncbi:DNA-3-methyladenine glycosylase 1 [Carnobacterium maltaromaticum]|uniref:DNA-3-methyladenine glycosylase I n=1 Tax=Carnobacterium maltaromaticum TaxID=2751 RepID=UPI00191B916B|nr:DNA-3-methyladenine glycosylase I [Carnobacterium maltaromaticum]CAD5901725.1 DNA-3-methyladenine glycosylase 1 [Carnobacterium maltaromaticum]